MSKSKKASLLGAIKLSDETISPGDIVMYKQSTALEMLTAAGQSLASLARRSKGGRFDTVSAGIAYNQTGDHFHLDAEGLHRAGIGERSVILFRTKEPSLQEEIRAVAISTWAKYGTDADSRKDGNAQATPTKYGAAKAIFSIFKSKNSNTGIVPDTEASFCSKFVVNTLKKAHRQVATTSALSPISAETSPKALEAYLRSHDDMFDIHHNISEKGKKQIIEVIEDQYTRLSKCGPLAKQKAQNLQQAIKELGSETTITDLLKKVTPILAENTGKGKFGATTSLKAITKVATKHGYGYSSEIKKWIGNSENTSLLKAQSQSHPPKERRRNITSSSLVEGMRRLSSSDASDSYRPDNASPPVKQRRGHVKPSSSILM